jgi:hypothetical protein
MAPHWAGGMGAVSHGHGGVRTAGAATAVLERRRPLRVGVLVFAVCLRGRGVRRWRAPVVVIGASALNAFPAAAAESFDRSPDGGCVIHKLIYDRAGKYIGERQTPEC